MKKLWFSLFTIVLVLGVTIAPMTAEAVNIKTRVPLIGQPDTSLDLPTPEELESGIPTNNYDAGEILCFATKTGGGLKRHVFRSVGGKTGQIRGIMRSGGEMLGWTMAFRTPNEEFAIGDDGDPRAFDLRYDARAENRIKNTSSLGGGRPRTAGGQAFITLLAIGESSRIKNIRFESGFVYDSERGYVPIVHARLPKESNRSFDFQCRI